jgi:hypothetical protein
MSLGSLVSPYPPSLAHEPQEYLENNQTNLFCTLQQKLNDSIRYEQHIGFFRYVSDPFDSVPV